ncbi:hypothetical protein AOLI_G00129570 [Acnodon oligacanthus]
MRHEKLVRHRAAPNTVIRTPTRLYWLSYKLLAFLIADAAPPSGVTDGAAAAFSPHRRSKTDLQLRMKSFRETTQAARRAAGLGAALKRAACQAEGPATASNPEKPPATHLRITEPPPPLRDVTAAAPGGWSSHRRLGRPRDVRTNRPSGAVSASTGPPAQPSPAPPQPPAPAPHPQLRRSRPLENRQTQEV